MIYIVKIQLSIIKFIYLAISSNSKDIMKNKKRLIIYILIFDIITLIILYFLFWPVQIDPVAWTPTEAPKMEGKYAPNNLINQAKFIKVPGIGPEDIAIDKSGNIYTGVKDGRIFKIMSDKKIEEFANTEGRPLGLMFDKLDNLIVGDAYKGLLSINKEGEITVLATEHNGIPFKFTDDLDIAEDGTIYFSDASRKFTYEDKAEYPLESEPNGRFLSYNPNTNETELLLDSLYFANGIAISPNQDYILVNETLRYRVTKYWIKGSKKGQSEIFIENLPGFPDGILYGNDGIYWLALASPRNKTLDDLLPKPFWRKVLIRLPEFLLPKPEDYGFALGLNEQGEVIYNLQSSDGTFGQVTNVIEYKGKLYFGSLHEEMIAILDKPKPSIP